MTRYRATVDNFFDRVTQEGDDPIESCWLWTGPLATSGYGVHGGMGTTHRISWNIFHGEIPDGLHLDHLCRVRRCVNPWHLDPVTIKVNNQRAWQHYTPVTHCKNGHALTEDNVYRWPAPDNRRQGCRTCRKAWVAACRERKAKAS